MMRAVNEVYGAYSGKVEEQHVRMEEALNLPVAAPNRRADCDSLRADSKLSCDIR